MRKSIIIAGALATLAAAALAQARPGNRLQRTPLARFPTRRTSRIPPR